MGQDFFYHATTYIYYYYYSIFYYYAYYHHSEILQDARVHELMYRYQLLARNVVEVLRTPVNVIR